LVGHTLDYQSVEITCKETHVDFAETVVEDTHVKVHALVDHCALLRIFGVELVVLAVLVDEISADGTALVHSEAVIDDGGHVVLRIDGHKLGFHVLTGLQVDFFQVELDADHFGRHPDGPARRTALGVVKVDRHFCNSFKLYFKITFLSKGDISYCGRVEEKSELPAEWIRRDRQEFYGGSCGGFISSGGRRLSYDANSFYTRRQS